MSDTMTAPIFTRHDLDPTLVATTVTKKISEIEQRRATAKKECAERIAFFHAAKHAGRRWTNDKQPESPDSIDPGYDRQIERERNHYAKVRVIERHDNATVARYLLVYGEEEDNAKTRGTGPFGTLDEAIGWFMKGGR